MSISSISNGESGSSVRTKLNSVIDIVNSGITTGTTYSFGITLDGQGTVITTGVTGTVIVPFNGVITGWDIFEISQTAITSSIVIDAWKADYGSYPPTVANTIFGTKPNLSGGIKNRATGLSIWVNEKDIFRFNVDSVTSAKLVQLIFYITRL